NPTQPRSLPCARLSWVRHLGTKLRKATSRGESEKADAPQEEDHPPLVVEMPEELAGDPLAELAYSLRMVHPRMVKKRPSGWKRFWYRGPEPYFDVFIDVDEEQNHEVQWFQFTYRGRYLTWDGKSDAVSTGITNEFSAEQMAYSSSKLLAHDAQTDSGLVGMVLDVLRFRTDSPPLVEARRRVQRSAAAQGLCRRPTLH
ncbi:MAG: hypothetical protein AAFQ82_27825, partial [Myxococcota bacterium]